MPHTDETTSGGTVRLLAGTAPSGRPVFENVPADRTAPDEWTLTASPGMAMGAAAGDVVRVRPDGRFDVLTRAGNIAVHAAGPTSATGQFDRLVQAVERLGGRLDGRGYTKDNTSSMAVFTIPYAAGFEAVEAAFNDYAATVPGGEWYYVNVYDPADDTTPLNWWQ
ncbi:DUF4265 domain-containing protein [Actinocrispum sp. NPDC049592]|uniref:DUF4265 domain-containing protein n=1 Tax=Actinocrispum sp. NPDC049592 TaxID=3154835 RepID=UPI003431072D